MNVLNYLGFILAGVLFAALCVTIAQFRTFRTSMERKLKAVGAQVVAAYDEIKRLKGRS